MQRPETAYVGIVNLLQECLDLFTFTAVEGVNDLGLQYCRQVLRRWTGSGFLTYLASSLGTHLHKSQVYVELLQSEKGLCQNES